MTDRAPVRIQRRRTKGWRMPKNTVAVSRPSRLGNPFPASTLGRAQAVAMHRLWLETAEAADLGYGPLETSWLNAERAAVLMQYYGSGGQHADLRAPLGAITTHDRFALVTVDGAEMPIVDIGMRMLSPRELQAAQGFPAAYDMTDGGRLTKTAQVRLIGNSVSPPVAAAVIRAQFPAARSLAA